MRVTVTASGTKEQVNNSIGQELARERKADQQAAHVLVGVRDYIADCIAGAGDGDAITVSASVSVSVTVTPKDVKTAVAESAEQHEQEQ